MARVVQYLVLLFLCLGVGSACQQWKELNKDREPDPRIEQKEMEKKRAKFFKSTPPPLDRPEAY